MGITKIFISDNAEIKRLRAAVEQNAEDDRWLDQLITNAEDCERSFTQAESAMKSEPSDANVARYCQSVLEKDHRAVALRRCRTLAQPGIVTRKIERLRAPLAAALTTFIAELEGKVATLTKAESELAEEVGVTPTQSSSIQELNREANRARATIQRLSEPLPLNGEGQMLGTMGRWCATLLGE